MSPVSTSVMPIQWTLVAWWRRPSVSLSNRSLATSPRPPQMVRNQHMAHIGNHILTAIRLHGLFPVPICSVRTVRHLLPPLLRDRSTQVLQLHSVLSLHSI